MTDRFCEICDAPLGADAPALPARPGGMPRVQCPNGHSTIGRGPAFGPGSPIGRPFAATDASADLVRHLGSKVRVRGVEAGVLANVHVDGTATIIDDRGIVVAIEPIEDVSVV